MTDPFCFGHDAVLLYVLTENVDLSTFSFGALLRALGGLTAWTPRTTNRLGDREGGFAAFGTEMAPTRRTWGLRQPGKDERLPANASDDGPSTSVFVFRLCPAGPTV
jgi:hypothetical protein